MLLVIEWPQSWIQRQMRDARTLSSCKLRSNEIMTRKAPLGYVYQVKVRAGTIQYYR